MALLRSRVAGRSLLIAVIAVLVASAVAAADVILLDVVGDFTTSAYAFNYYTSDGAGISTMFHNLGSFQPSGWLNVGGVNRDGRHLPRQHVFLQFNEALRAPCVTESVTISRTRLYNGTTGFPLPPPDFTRSCDGQSLVTPYPTVSATRSIDLCGEINGQLDVALDFLQDSGAVGEGYVGYRSRATVVDPSCSGTGCVIASDTDCLQIYWGAL